MKRLITLTDNNTSEMVYIPIEKITRIVCIDVNGRKLTEIHTGSRTPAIVLEPAGEIAVIVDDAFRNNFVRNIPKLGEGRRIKNEH